MASLLAGPSRTSSLSQPNMNRNRNGRGRRRTIGMTKAGAEKEKEEEKRQMEIKRLLCLSNGHGEDEVAVSILKEITCMGRTKLEVKAVPLVGMGHAYKRCGIATVGPSKHMPSGGFNFTSTVGLLQDIHAGLILLIVLQWKTIEAWVKENPDGTVLAVGDVFPLLLAWMAARKSRKLCKGNLGSGIKYIFVGTAKSDYYFHDDNKFIHKLGLIDYTIATLFRWSVYFPWERSMMTDSNCCLVVPRDSFTAATLKKTLPPSAGAKIKYLGNPMMDNLKPSGVLDFLKKQIPSLYVALLPGSRAPEVYFNWKTILDAVESLITSPISDKIIFLVPIFPSLESASFSQSLLSMGWKPAASESIIYKIEDLVLCVENIMSTSSNLDEKSDILHSFSYKKGTAFLLLTRGLFPDVVNLADAAIAMAGTATEQLVGLGKPVFTLPGKGPQFTCCFAQAQARLLGKSIIICSRTSIGQEMAELLNDMQFMEFCKQNGLKRMGTVGASCRIALEILNLIWDKDIPSLKM